jgi:hypothetical protein
MAMAGDPGAKVHTNKQAATRLGRNGLVMNNWYSCVSDKYLQFQLSGDG